MYDNVDSKYCEPPGTFREIIAHPGGYDRVIEKAIIMEHRFAFFYWMKWHHELKQKNWLKQPAPTLITIDWHRDLAAPSPKQKEELERLDPEKKSVLSNYIWARFDQTNDGHILCAAWLNIIGDVILLKNSASEMHNTFEDSKGNIHHIYEFREYDRFEKFLLERDDANIFLDIDLDYFIHGQGNVVYPDTFERYSDQEIKKLVDPQKPAFRKFLPGVDGITIAQEPAYCGGILNSCKIMETVHSQLFNAQNGWRHLTEDSLKK